MASSAVPLSDLRAACYGIPAEEIARVCHVCVTTARRWKRGTRCAPKSALLLLRGDLSAFDPQWRGWQARGGKLISPEGWEITVGDVLALPLMHQRLAAYKVELEQWQELVSRFRAMLKNRQPIEAIVDNEAFTLLQQAIPLLDRASEREAAL
jgi:hypothetical protein